MEKRMKKRERKFWLTTDTHLGHAKMHTFCDRPEEFEWKVLKGFEVLHEEDILIHLGDFAFTDDEYWAEKFFEHVPCKAWLLKGNHDKRSDFWYLDKGFSFVGRSLTLKRFGYKILFSHMPQEWHGQFDLNLFGHFHNNDHRFWETWLVNRITPEYHQLLALEDMDYKPLRLKNIVEEHRGV